MRRWDGKLFGVGAVIEQPRGFLGGKHGDGAELAVDLARAHADELIQLRAGLLDALLRGGEHVLKGGELGLDRAERF